MYYGLNVKLHCVSLTCATTGVAVSVGMIVGEEKIVCYFLCNPNLASS